MTNKRLLFLENICQMYKLRGDGVCVTIKKWQKEEGKSTIADVHTVGRSEFVHIFPISKDRRLT